MTINNVSTQDLLYTKTGKHQSQIKECQVFMSGVNIETNVTIATLNDRNVSLTYEENVKTSENVTIKGSVVRVKVYMLVIQNSTFHICSNMYCNFYAFITLECVRDSVN